MVNLDDIAHKRISDTNLTVQDLVSLVEEVIIERLHLTQRESNLPSSDNINDWWQSMVTDIITLPVGTPSVTEMLRAERDEW